MIAEQRAFCLSSNYREPGEQFATDDVILAEIGTRIARRRLDMGFTQAQVAEQAGVANRTLEWIEAGGSAQMSNMIRILQVLIGPIDRLKREGKVRLWGRTIGATTNKIRAKAAVNSPSPISLPDRFGSALINTRPLVSTH